MATAAELEARVRALALPPSTASDTAADVGMSVASGIPRAIASLLGSPVEWLNAASRNIPQGAIPFFPTLGVPSVPPEQTLSTQITGERRTVPPVQVPYGGIEDFRNIARAYESPTARGGVPVPGETPAPSLIDYRPTTDAGRYAQTGTEWAVPALIGGPGDIVRRIGTGLLGGTASEGMHDLVNRVVPEAYRGYVAPILDTAAGLLTMHVANRPFMARSNPAAVVADRTRDVTPAQWQVAEGRMQAAPPGTLLPAEALGTAGGPLQGLTSDVMASRAGGPITQALAGRAPAVVQAGEQAIAGVGGPVRSTADVVQDVSEGARNVIGEAAGARTRASQPHFDAASTEQVPLAAFNPIIANINAQIAREGANSQVGRALADLRDNIINASSGTTVQVGPLNNLRRETTQGLYPTPPGQTTTVVPRRPMDATEQAVVGPHVTELTNTLEQLSPNFRTAMDLYRTNSARVNAVEQPNVMGNLQTPVTPSTRTPAMLADQAAILTGEGVTAPQINRVFGELSMSNQPQAARDLGARLLRNELDAAAGRARSATNPDAPLTGAQFADALLRSPEAAARTEAIVRGMARANGQNPDVAWTGFARMLDTFTQHGRIPGVGSRTAPRGQLAGELGSNWVSNIVDLANTRAGSLPGRISTWAGERAGGADYEALARVLSDTSPQSIQLLRQMAGQIPGSPRAQAMLTRALEAARVLGNTAAPQDQR